MSDALPLDLGDGDWVIPESCPLCAMSSSLSHPFDALDAENRHIAYVICGACGLVYQSPHASESWLRSYYQGGYHLHIHGQHHPGAKTEWVETKRAEALLAFARHHLADVRNHLDVGSSMGKLLAAFHGAFGSRMQGVEPAQAYRWMAHKLGVDAVGRLADLDSSLGRSFDLVSLSHVLEHMTDPIGVLRRLHAEWMADGAHLLVEVPNLFGHPSLEFAHLFAFTRDTLIGALRRAGFAPIAVELHGQPHSRRLPFYVRILSEREPGPSPHIVSRPSLPMIRLKRWLGMTRLNAVWAVSSRLLGSPRLAPWAE